MSEIRGQKYVLHVGAGEYWVTRQELVNHDNSQWWYATDLMPRDELGGRLGDSRGACGIYRNINVYDDEDSAIDAVVQRLGSEAERLRSALREGKRVTLSRVVTCDCTDYAHVKCLGERR